MCSIVVAPTTWSDSRRVSFRHRPGTNPSECKRERVERAHAATRSDSKWNYIACCLATPDGASDPFRPRSVCRRSDPKTAWNSLNSQRLATFTTDTVGTILLVCGEWMDGVGSLCYTQGGGKGMRLNLYWHTCRLDNVSQMDFVGWLRWIRMHYRNCIIKEIPLSVGLVKLESVQVRLLVGIVFG